MGIDYGERRGRHFPYYFVQNLVGSTGSDNRSVFLIDDSSHIVVSGFRVKGSNSCKLVPYYNCYMPSLEGQAGFVVGGSRDITITDNVISHVWGDCAQVGDYNADDHGWTDGVTFSRNSCDHLGRHGWSSNSGENFRFSDNTYSMIAYDAVDLEDDSGGPTMPVGCTTGCSGAGWVNVTSSYERFADVGLDGIAVQGGANMTGESINFRHDTFGGGTPQFLAYTNEPNPYFGPISLTNSIATSSAMSNYRDGVELTGVVNGISRFTDNALLNMAYGCTTTCEYQQPYGFGIWSSRNIVIENNNVEAAGHVAEIDSRTDSLTGRSPNRASPSINVTVCGNRYSLPSRPEEQSRCRVDTTRRHRSVHQLANDTLVHLLVSRARD
ncbi:MAG: hypothetical protein ACRDZR_03695 [Acidimicrobiales bacterium]